MLKSAISVQKHELHIWRIDLASMPDKEFLLLLSPDELARANRFKFEIHRHRYIVARGALRTILSKYIEIPADKIIFEYGHHGKPFLLDENIKFNISHSDNLALVAITKDAEVGIDLEKMDPTFKEDVAKRFFSKEEYNELQQLPESEKIPAFYKIWTMKEALIKVVGEGLFVPLDEFTVSSQLEKQVVSLHFQNRLTDFYLQSLFVHPEYQAVVATSDKIQSISIVSTLLPGKS